MHPSLLPNNTKILIGATAQANFGGPMLGASTATPQIGFHHMNSTQANTLFLDYHVETFKKPAMDNNTDKNTYMKLPQP